MVEYIPQAGKQSSEERRRIENESLYSYELDLWDSTRLAKLNFEDRMKEIMDRVK